MTNQGCSSRKVCRKDHELAIWREGEAELGNKGVGQPKQVLQLHGR